MRATPYGGRAAAGPGNALRGKLVGLRRRQPPPEPLRRYGRLRPGRGAPARLRSDDAPALDDPWAQARVVDMLARRLGPARARWPSRPGAAPRRRTSYEVHRALDPNENFGPPWASAALLLVLYSVVAGPLNFLRAPGAGGRCARCVWPPVASAGVLRRHGGASASPARAGAAARATSRWSRPAPGMSRGTVRRFRGFFACQRGRCAVRATEPASVLDVVTDGLARRRGPPARLDREGAAARGPHEPALADGGGARGRLHRARRAGIAVVKKGDGSVVVVEPHRARSERRRAGRRDGRQLLRPAQGRRHASSPPRAARCRRRRRAADRDGRERAPLHAHRSRRTCSSVLGRRLGRHGDAVVRDVRRRRRGDRLVPRRRARSSSASSTAARAETRRRPAPRERPAARPRRRLGRCAVSTDAVIPPAAPPPRAATSRPPPPSASATSGTASARSTCCATSRFDVARRARSSASSAPTAPARPRPSG